MRSRTKLVSLEKLASKKEAGAFLIRLMMVVNDCAIAEETATMWRARLDKKTETKREEAFKYFVELQIGHLHEGLTMVREIAKKPELMELVDQCGPRTREQFSRLIVHEPSAAFGYKVMRIRNKLVSHYDSKMVSDELQAHVREHPRSAVLISIGTTSECILFEPGALINERIATRQVFEVPPEADAYSETTKLMLELESIMEDFVNFAASLVWTHSHS